LFACNHFVSMASSKGGAAAVANTVKAIRALHNCVQNTESRMSRVEEASNYFGATQKKKDDKLDEICLMLA
jgi:hypothetical protein